MSENGYAFDATGVEPSSPLETIPAGWYRAMITSSELKPTKAGTGQYLEFTWKVLDGEFEGRIVWDRLNVINPNDTAREIAERALSAICHAVGVLKFSRPEQLHHKPALIKVVVKQDKGYEPSNEIKGYKDVSDKETGKLTPAIRAVAQKHGTMPAALKDDNDDLPF